MNGQKVKNIQLPEVLNNVSCADLQAEILEWLESQPQDSSLCLDVSKVERMGTVALQLLVSASVHCKKSKISMQFSGITPYFLETVQDLGCFSHFQSQGILS